MGNIEWWKATFRTDTIFSIVPDAQSTPLKTKQNSIDLSNILSEKILSLNFDWRRVFCAEILFSKLEQNFSHEMAKEHVFNDDELISTLSSHSKDQALDKSNFNRNEIYLKELFFRTSTQLTKSFFIHLNFLFDLFTHRTSSKTSFHSFLWHVSSIVSQFPFHADLLTDRFEWNATDTRIALLFSSIELDLQLRLMNQKRDQIDYCDEILMAKKISKRDDRTVSCF
jgi:hypothetical protein